MSWFRDTFGFDELDKSRENKVYDKAPTCT